ncbi:hypothetical protein HN51_027418 [Arachis hypogaea]|nr:kinesin-like protein KIN-5D [Arachis hypogaea]
MGAKPTMITGLSGTGDIMLTCFVNLSRNRIVGVRLGLGEKLEDILSSMSQNGKFLSDAGVICGAVKQMFDILEAQNAEHNLKVTFLELYNEEITDRVAPEETVKFVDDNSKSPIALMEDWKGGFH